MTIVCTSDKKYIPVFQSLYFSIRQNYGNCQIVLRLIDCNSLDLCSEVRYDPNVRVIVDQQNLSTKRNKLTIDQHVLQDTLWASLRKRLTKSRGARWFYSDLVAYASNIKYNTINTLLDEGVERILYMDVDAVVRKPLDGLENLIEDSDIVIMKDKGDTNPSLVKPISEPDGILWHCGIIGFNNTETTRLFCKELEERVMEDKFEWDADQIQFHNVFNKFIERIKFTNLPRTYKDEGTGDLRFGGMKGFLEDSHIWCGAGESKYTDEGYVSECKKYGEYL